MILRRHIIINLYFIIFTIGLFLRTVNRPKMQSSMNFTRLSERINMDYSLRQRELDEQFLGFEPLDLRFHHEPSPHKPKKAPEERLKTQYSPRQRELDEQFLGFEPLDPRYHHEPDPQKTLEKRPTLKILYYTVFMNRKHWFGLGREPFLECQYSACETTSDKREMVNAHAVLVNDVDIPRDFVASMDSLQRNRNPDQKWILSMSEPPVKSFMMYTPLNGFFNLTLNHKQTADIYTPYFFIARRKSILPAHNRNFARQKPQSHTNLVAWFNSNCNTHSKREDYVNQLQKHIQVDIYGACGSLKCPKNFTHLNSVSKSSVYIPDSCEMLLNTTYKFYLAFENSICPDYVTEKIYRALVLDVVPVVLGGADYEKLLPPHSYINVKDFASPQHLAKFLLDLDKNAEEYNAYFEWKRYFSIERFSRACSLCEYLHVNARRRSIARDIDAGWSYTDCMSPKQYHNGTMGTSH